MNGKPNKTFLYIGLGVCVALAAGLSIGLVVNRNRKKREIKELIAAINNTDTLTGGAGATGTSSDIYDADIWNPRIYFKKSGVSPATMDFKTASKWAAEIYNSKGFGLLPDNEPRAITALKHSNNRTDIAKIADAFQVNYKQPLESFLKSFMDNTDVYLSDRKNYNDEVQKIILSLPK